MKLSRLFKKDFVIGIDIGSSSVKMAQFIITDGKPQLAKTAIEPHENEPSAAIKRLFKGIDIKRSKFIAVVNCPDTAIRTITAPIMPRQELYQAISMSAKNYFPFPADKACLDFQVSGEVTEKGIRKYKLLVAISPKDTINKTLSILSKLGIRPISLIPAGYALQRIATSAPGAESGVNCLLDIGARFTELVILKSGEFVFSRKIPVAGNDFTKAMTEVLVSDRGKTELSFIDAEKIKKETGIPAETESRSIADNISTSQILSLLHQPLAHLVSEIQRSFDYYREESGTDKIDSLVLFGGGSLLKGLSRFLSKELEMPVKPGEALDKKISCCLELAAAAALSETGVNLLPAEIKEQTKRAVRRAAVKAIVTAVVVILALIYTGMKLQLENFQKRVAVSELELKSLAPQLEEARMCALAAGLLVDEPFWDDIFKELSNIAPENVCITGLSFENKTIRIKASVSGGDAERAVSIFIQGLQKGIFKDVRLKASLGNEFELTCWVK